MHSEKVAFMTESLQMKSAKCSTPSSLVRYFTITVRVFTTSFKRVYSKSMGIRMRKSKSVCSAKRSSGISR